MPTYEKFPEIMSGFAVFNMTISASCCSSCLSSVTLASIQGGEG